MWMTPTRPPARCPRTTRLVIAHASMTSRALAARSSAPIVFGVARRHLPRPQPVERPAAQVEAPQVAVRDDAGQAPGAVDDGRHAEPLAVISTTRVLEGGVARATTGHARPPCA